MGEFKGTPGPWRLECGDHTHRYVTVVGSDDLTVFYKYGAGSKQESDRDEINARLIAASPELLAAAKALVMQREQVVQLIEDYHAGKLLLSEFEHEVTGALTGSTEIGDAKRARAAIARALGSETGE